MTITNNTVALALAEQIHCQRTHRGCIDTILTGRASSTLHVTQNRRTRLNAGCSLDTLRHTCRMSDTLRIDNNVMLFAAFTVLDDMVYNLLLIVIIFLRKQDILCAVRNTAP